MIYRNTVSFLGKKFVLSLRALNLFAASTFPKIPSWRAHSFKISWSIISTEYCGLNEFVILPEFTIASSSPFYSILRDGEDDRGLVVVYVEVEQLNIYLARLWDITLLIHEKESHFQNHF